jgi:hypothetical protein
MERHQAGSAQIIKNFLIGIDVARSSQLHRRQGKQRSGNLGHVCFQGYASKVVIGHGLIPHALFCQRNRDLAVCFGREGIQN